MIDVIPDTLEDQIAWIVRQIGEMQRRDRNRKRTGKVTEVDFDEGLARVEFRKEDGEPYLSPWLPWKEIAAGGIKSHIPPTVGEQVDVVSENGDLTDAQIDMSTPSNENPRPHNGPEAVVEKGGTRLVIADDKVTLTTDHFEINGSSITHNGREIGHTHKHTKTQPGGGLSGVPQG